MSYDFQPAPPPPPIPEGESKFWKNGDHLSHLVAFVAPVVLIEDFTAGGKWKDPSDIARPAEMHCVTCARSYDGEVTGSRLVRQLTQGPNVNMAGRLIRNLHDFGAPFELETLISADDSQALARYFTETTPAAPALDVEPY